PLLDIHPHPEAWGTHGWERKRAGEPIEVRPLDRSAREAIATASQWIRDHNYTTLSETKPASVTIHWRDMDDENAEALKAEARGAWKPLTERAPVELHEFDGGLEIRVQGRNK